MLKWITRLFTRTYEVTGGQCPSCGGNHFSVRGRRHICRTCHARFTVIRCAYR